MLYPIGRRVLTAEAGRYLPVRDPEGAYLGVLEVTQGIGEIQKLTGQETLLDG